MANGFASTNSSFYNPNPLTGNTSFPVSSTTGANGLPGVGLSNGQIFTGMQSNADGSIGGVINGRQPQGQQQGFSPGQLLFTLGLQAAQGASPEDLAWSAGGQVVDSFLPGAGSAINFGRGLANGMDGREAVASGLSAAVQTGATILSGGNPLIGAAAGRYFQPAIQDTVSLGQSSEATKNAIANRTANFLSGGLNDVSEFLGIKEIKELSLMNLLGVDADFIASGLGKTGLFGKQNKASVSRENLAKGLNKRLEEAGVDVRINDFYKQFTPGGEIERKLGELKSSRGEDAVRDQQRVGSLLGLIDGFEDAGKGNVGNMIVASTEGDPEKLKQVLEGTGATPDGLFEVALRGFQQGKASVVETVEAVRALDRLYGTGFAGSEQIKQIASMVEEGGSDKLVDGRDFDSSKDIEGQNDGIEFNEEQSSELPQNAPLSQTKPFQFNTNDPQSMDPGFSRPDLDPRLPQNQTRPASLSSESSASIDVGMSNLVDSFSRVQSGNSLTPDNPVDDIRFSMQILSERLRQEGRDPNSDETIKQAQSLIQRLGGEFI